MNAFFVAVFRWVGCFCLFSGALVQAKEKEKEETWAIYWYLCGSDLERKHGAASADLEEMLDADLPENVKVVIQTGGAAAWHSEEADIPADKIARFVYSEGELERVATLPQANMGDASTLEGFLKFCRENHDADHKVFIFWNHGGGSIGGAACDENFEMDALSLKEMKEAFGKVFEVSEEEPPFEVIGFDTCLMASLDTAKTFQGLGRYLVASEELEPGNGWFYTGWLDALGEDTSMDGKALGKVICDSYLEGCREAGTVDEATLSVVDLSGIGKLSDAYDLLGYEAVVRASEDSKVFAKLGRQAQKAENYSNSSKGGCSNMVDMGQMVKNAGKLLPEHSSTVLEALQECVVYKVNGPYRKSNGLSCYYPFDGDKENFGTMLEQGPSSFIAYYGWQFGFVDLETASSLAEVCAAAAHDALFGEEGGEENELEALPEKLEEVKSDIDKLEDFPVKITDDGNALLALGADRAEWIDRVNCVLAIVDAKEDIIVFLGSDANLDVNWDAGTFEDRFNGKWAHLDGHLLYMDFKENGETFYRYEVPVLLNGVKHHLSVVYDFKEEGYKILGARKVEEGSKMGEKNLVKLKEGDKITTLMYGLQISGEDSDPKEVEIDTFTLGKAFGIKDEDMGDGEFAYLFDMYDVQNRSAMSDIVFFTSKDGKISVSDSLDGDSNEGSEEQKDEKEE